MQGANGASPILLIYSDKAAFLISSRAIIPYLQKRENIIKKLLE
jgi:hypothetical protein